jgi:hypothetical protein
MASLTSLTPERQIPNAIASKLSLSVTYDYHKVLQ